MTRDAGAPPPSNAAAAYRRVSATARAGPGSLHPAVPGRAAATANHHRLPGLRPAGRASSHCRTDHF